MKYEHSKFGLYSWVFSSFRWLGGLRLFFLHTRFVWPLALQLWSGTQTGRQAGRQAGGWTGRQAGGQAGRQAGGWVGGQAGRQAGKQAGRRKFEFQ